MNIAVILLLEVIRHNGYEDAHNEIFVGNQHGQATLAARELRHELISKTIIRDWSVAKNPCSRNIMLNYARMSKLGSLVFFYELCLVSTLVLANLFDLLWTSGKRIYNRVYEKKLILATDFDIPSWKMYLLLSRLLLHQSAAATADPQSAALFNA